MCRSLWAITARKSGSPVSRKRVLGAKYWGGHKPGLGTREINTFESLLLERPRQEWWVNLDWLTDPSSHSLTLTSERWRGKISQKIPWVQTHFNYCLQQNKLNLGKINFMYSNKNRAG